MKHLRILIISLLFSYFLSLISCIPAYEVEDKIYKLDKRVSALEMYRDKELKRMKKQVESLLIENEKMKKEIGELLLRTSIIGEKIEEDELNETTDESIK
ncbi:MAG: hypothetical protein D6734_12610 [Candidatus Schekmanbacteria bacterium]|nr:MAG: hypothetical protein D6734_12610 [Candidatus Schekmanbacteria bacterium]